MENEILKALDELAGKNFAVGNDLVFIPNFKSSLTPLFINKVYTAAEIAYCDSFHDDALTRYASTWAAKEAVYKALKQLDTTAATGWKKIEIIRQKAAGKPQVVGPCTEGYNISLTLSHDGDYAWAVAFVQINQGKPA